MASKPFKVIIVGGSIAGLTLALILQKNGIDFVVLEGYSSIAPQVVASIGVLPNGLRILDQLGCCDRVTATAEYPVDKAISRDSQGRQFWALEDLNKEIVGRHGYPIVFLDRRMLIKILYDAIEDKSKVLTSERVLTVQTGSSHATVITKSGKTYTGDIVVGADGVHSTVRQQMWLEAQKNDPSWIDPSEEDALPATYACIFGISQGVSGIEKGTLTSVFNENFSYLVPSGPGDRTYWFLVRNMGKTVYGKDIPRFTKQEEEALAKEHWNDCITPTLRFSDLYEKRISSVYTALPEYVYKKWYFQRIITIGDASHKFEPLTGQGGNSAIETAAALGNKLVEALNNIPQRPLSTDVLSKVFEQTQRQRHDRVWALVKGSHARQRLECMETPTLKFVAKYIFPYIPRQSILERWIPTYCPAVSLNMLPSPNRPNSEPFHDQLLRKPGPRGRIKYAIYASYIILATIAWRRLFGAGAENGTWSMVSNALAHEAVADFTSFTGVNSLLKNLVTFFLPIVTSKLPEHGLHLVYFLSTLAPLLAIFTIEGFRPRNKWTLLALPSLWAALCQLFGIGVVAPLYFLVYSVASRGVAYMSPSSRVVPIAVSQAILPALVLGYIIPTMLMLFPFVERRSLQGIIALWQPAPVFVSILTGMFAWILNLMRPAATAAVKVNTNLHDLELVYKVTGVLSACVHGAVIMRCMISKNLILTQVFIPAESFAPVSNLADGVFIFLQNDFLMVATAVLLWCWVSIWDLYRVGLSDMNWLKGLMFVLTGFVLIGPGSTVAFVWHWREKIMSGHSLVRK